MTVHAYISEAGGSSEKKIVNSEPYLNALRGVPNAKGSAVLGNLHLDGMR